LRALPSGSIVPFVLVYMTASPSLTTTTSSTTTTATTTTTTTTTTTAAAAAAHNADTTHTVNVDITVIPVTMLPASRKFNYFLYLLFICSC